MLKGIFKLSLAALSLNKVRSLLTTLGVVFGAGILIIVLTIGSGFRAFILEEISVITPETLWVEILVPSEGTRMEQNFQTAQSVGAGVQITTMKMEDVEDIKRLPNIEDGYGMVITQERLTYDNNEKIAMIFGVGDAYDTEVGGFGFEIDQGRFFSNEEDLSLSQVVVLGSEVKEKLFENRDPIGENIKIKGLNFRVIGVAKEAGSVAFMDIDNLIYLPTRTTMEKIMGIDYILGMGFKLEDPSKIALTTDAVEKQLRINHNITDPKKDDFAVRTMDEAMEIISVVTDTVEILLLVVALISLVVGGVGIMNVMYTSVTERTNEIGLKKALGAKPAAIRLQFLMEAVIITFIGALIGISLGIILSWVASIAIQATGFDWQFVLEFEDLVFAFAMPVAIGLVFGYAPAKKASELDPIEALRETI